MSNRGQIFIWSRLDLLLRRIAGHLMIHEGGYRQNASPRPRGVVQAIGGDYFEEVRVAGMPVC
jgi:hypothetical protein